MLHMEWGSVWTPQPLLMASQLPGGKVCVSHPVVPHECEDWSAAPLLGLVLPLVKSDSNVASGVRAGLKPSLLFASHCHLGKVLDLSSAQCSHVENGNSNPIHFRVRDLNELI